MNTELLDQVLQALKERKLTLKSIIEYALDCNIEINSHTFNGAIEEVEALIKANSEELEIVATATYKDLYKLGLKKDKAGRWDTQTTTPDYVIEYLRHFRSPSRAWPLSYAKALMTQKFAKYLTKHDPAMAIDLGIARKKTNTVNCKKDPHLYTFEFENGQALKMPSLGEALEYAHKNNCRIIRHY